MTVSSEDSHVFQHLPQYHAAPVHLPLLRAVMVVSHCTCRCDGVISSGGKLSRQLGEVMQEAAMHYCVMPVHAHGQIT
jgi:hypothetical protein